MVNKANRAGGPGVLPAAAASWRAEAGAGWGAAGQADYLPLIINQIARHFERAPVPWPDNSLAMAPGGPLYKGWGTILAFIWAK